ncbi:MAG: peptidoglycan DD-metalloendopeptidase family protein [Oscillospiraceae bacterium]|nr:peptidoglycan DD-metalloendopeptidase family protein [Oscillospiraceae bacterium]
MAQSSYAEKKNKTRKPSRAGNTGSGNKLIDGIVRFIYRFLYYTGVQVLRSANRKKRYLKRKYQRVYWLLKIKRHSLKEELPTKLERAWFVFCSPFLKLRDSVLLYKKETAKIPKDLPPKERFMAYWHEFEETTLEVALKYLKEIFKLIGPGLSLLILLITIQHYGTAQYVLSVEYNGEYVGEIADESVYRQAEKEVRKRIIHEEYIEPESAVPTFKIIPKRGAELIDVNTLTDALISASGNKLVEADGFYVDNEFMGAVEDGNKLIDMLQRFKDKHRTGAENEEIAFVKDIKLLNGLYPVTSITDVASLEKQISREVSAQRSYVVQEGDSPWIIAEKMDVPLAVVLNLNPGIEDSLLIGQEILVAKAEPFLATQVVRTLVYEEEIPFSVIKTRDSSMSLGSSKVTKKGVNGLREVTEQVTLINGLEVDRKILNSVTLKEAVPQEMIVGTMRPVQYVQQITGGNVSGFICPVQNAVVSCGYWGYYGHTGIDLVLNGGTYGAPIYASAAGTVEYSGWGGAYGYQVVINHGGGVKTRYAHNSALYVSAGQYVQQGQHIAAIGRTGRVTGPHLHFEIIVNGGFKNPAYYIF